MLTTLKPKISATLKRETNLSPKQHHYIEQVYKNLINTGLTASQLQKIIHNPYTETDPVWNAIIWLEHHGYALRNDKGEFHLTQNTRW